MGWSGVWGGREGIALAYFWLVQKQLLIVGMYVLLVKRPQGPAHVGLQDKLVATVSLSKKR